MTDSKIVFEYLRKSSTISSVATEHNLSKASVVSSIQKFLASRGDTNYCKVIRYKFNVEMIRNFLAQNFTAKDFAVEHGMIEKEFLILAKEIVDDPEIVTSDAVANKIYRKLLTNRKSLGQYTPNRIIILLAKCYVADPWITQSGIASSYNISRSSIASIFKRGIENGILSHELANEVISKSCYKQGNHHYKVPKRHLY